MINFKLFYLIRNKKEEDIYIKKISTIALNGAIAFSLAACGERDYRSEQTGYQ